MSELYFMVSITQRRKFPSFLTLFQQRGVLSSFISLGHGTAAGDLLGYLGLTNSEKAFCCSVVTGEVWKTLKRDMQRKLQIDVPGVGVSFIIPMSSIGGKRELMFLTEQQGYQKGEEQAMTGTQRELLVVISNQGYNELVMDAAREAGAQGGTVLHARGTGMERAERFLGVSLASEKDMTFIVTRTNRKNALMESIMRKAGMDSPAKSIVFTLPVTDTAGLRLLEEEEEPQEEEEREQIGQEAQ